MFPVEGRYRRSFVPVERPYIQYFGGWKTLTPLIFLLSAGDIAICLVDRHERSQFSSSMPLTPLFYRLNAVNAALFPVERRYR